jgi:hypothetical protein
MIYRKTVAVLMILCILVLMPVRLYASTLMYSDVIKPTATGVTAMNAFAKKRAVGWLAGRALLGFAGTAVGVVMLGMAVYEAGSQISDLWRTQWNVTGTTFNNLSGGTGTFGQVISSGSSSCMIRNYYGPVNMTCTGRMLIIWLGRN